MGTEVNGKPIRVRGGKRGISDRDMHLLRMSDISKGSKSQLPKGALGASIFWMVADNEETTRDHVVPRTSVTVAQHLKIWPTEATYEDRTVRTYVRDLSIPSKVPAKVLIQVVNKGTSIVNGRLVTNIAYQTMIDSSSNHYVESTDSKVVKKGEKSLLLGGKPFTDIATEIEHGEFKRLTSQSKRIINERVNHSPIPDSLTTVQVTKIVGNEELPILTDKVVDTSIQTGTLTKKLVASSRPDLADTPRARYAGHDIPRCRHGIFMVTCSVCKELAYK